MTKKPSVDEDDVVDDDDDADDDEVDIDDDDLDDEGDAASKAAMAAVSRKAKSTKAKSPKTPSKRRHDPVWQGMPPELKWARACQQWREGAKILIKRILPREENLPFIQLNQLRAASGGVPDFSDCEQFIRNKYWRGEDETYLLRWTQGNTWRCELRTSFAEDLEKMSEYQNRRERSITGSFHSLAQRDPQPPHAPYAPEQDPWSASDPIWTKQQQQRAQQQQQPQPPPQYSQPAQPGQPQQHPQYQPAPQYAQFAPPAPAPPDGIPYDGRPLPPLPPGLVYSLSPQGLLTIIAPAVAAAPPPAQPNLTQDPAFLHLLRQNEDLLKRMADLAQQRGAEPGISESIMKQRDALREGLVSMLETQKVFRDFGPALGLVDARGAELAAQQAADRSRQETEARMQASLASAGEVVETPTNMLGRALGAFAHHAPQSTALATSPAAPAVVEDPSIVTGPFGWRGKKLDDGKTDWTDFGLNGQAIEHVGTVAFNMLSEMLEKKKNAASEAEKAEIDSLQKERQRLQIREQQVLLEERAAVAAGVRRSVENGEIQIDPAQAARIRDEIRTRVEQPAPTTVGPRFANNAPDEIEYE